ncbi:MAG: hydantoinase/oxoprolinase family protein [Candidatus Latescibacteria bacterium]|nr:hydantoinase/oxoprolinase family protein [Candidatus Latescibacterota bacterium]
MVEEQYVLAIDIGGTFTDLVLLDCHTGRQAIAKVPTTYPDPSDAVLSGIDSLPGFCDPGAVQRVIHGTTLVTNTLIERKGARTGLITTAGFRDALEIGREGRYDIYDLRLELPEPLVERRLRFGALERMNVRGEILEHLDESSIRDACSTFLDEGVEAVAICFLHAYANPEHERQAARIVGKAMPGVPVSVSHQVSPELREYDRTSTTVANAYVQPLARRYLAGLSGGLEAKGIEAPLHIMLSNGGVCSAETAASFPVRLVESGPSGGALSAAYWGGRSDLRNVLAFDMGGTTAKAVLGSDGAFPVTTESEVARVYRFKRGSGLPLLVPVLDMIEIGAGGGSIAHLNEMGLPAVGPESAGSVPGPACYGQGGVAPTVTDADLILGMLNPGYFLGGKMALDLDRARRAVQGLSKRLGMDVNRMAWGIHRMINENMANAARVHAAERGIDIRGYAMVATGGAGPVHACGVAERLGIRTVIVPPTAGVSSAFGLMLAPISFDFARSYVARLGALNYARLNTLFEAMETEGADVLREAGVAPSRIRIERTADMRYVGQGHEIRIPIPGGRLSPRRLDEIRENFDAEYTRKFTRTCEGVEIESVHWRVRMSGPKPDLGDPKPPPSTDGDGFKGVRPVLFDPESGPEPAPVFDRYGIESGFRATGPAIVEEAESTAVVPHGWTIAVEVCGNLLLTRMEELG